MTRRFVVLGSVLMLGTLMLALELTGNERIHAQQAPRAGELSFLEVGKLYTIFRQGVWLECKILEEPRGHWVKVLMDGNGFPKSTTAWLNLDTFTGITPKEPELENPQPEGKPKAKGDEKPAGAGFGPAQFGPGVEKIQGVEVKVGDPQFTLTWDTDADLDLHVIEPGGKEIYWEEPKGAPDLGGAMDVDCTKGFGPENISWRREPENGGKSPRPGPSGEYQWYVIYWGGFRGIAKLTHWTVRIKHEGKTEVVTGVLHQLNERSKHQVFKVEPADKP